MLRNFVLFIGIALLLGASYQTGCPAEGSPKRIPQRRQGILNTQPNFHDKGLQDLLNFLLVGFFAKLAVGVEAVQGSVRTHLRDGGRGGVPGHQGQRYGQGHGCRLCCQ